MPSQQDLTLATLFKAVEDGSFKRTVGKLTGLLNGLNTSLAKVNQASKKVQAASAKVTSALNSQSQSTKKATQQMQGLALTVDRVANSFKTAARYFVAYRLFHGVTRGAREGVAEIVNFDQALHNLAAISSATGGEIDVMRDKILDVASKTKYSTTEIAEGMVLLTQSGLTAAEATQAIGSVAALAAGTLSEFGSTADLVTTTLRAFNLNANETSRVADVMANAVNKSKATIDKLRTTFNYIGVSAHQAGMSLERTAASTMMLYNAGIRASTVGTGLRQVLARLLAPNENLREAMGRYGLEIDRASGKQEWFEKQVGKLSAVLWDAKTNTVDMSKAYELFGLRGAQTAAVLVSSYMDLNGTWEKTYEMASRVGTALKMQEEQLKGLAAKAKNLGDKLKNLAIALGEGGFTAVLGGAIDLLRGATDALTKFANTMGGKVLANTILFTGIVWGLVTAVKTLLIYLPKIKAAMAFFASPTALGIVAIGALVGLIFTLYDHYKKLSTAATKAAASYRSLVSSLDGYQKRLSSVVEGSQEHLDIVAQLKEEYPDYANQIDRVKNSYSELNKVMKEIRLEEEKKSLEAVTKAFAEQSTNIDYLLRRYNEYRMRTKENVLSLDKWVEKNGDLLGSNKRALKSIEDLTSGYKDLLLELYEKEGWEKVKEQIDSLIVSSGSYMDRFNMAGLAQDELLNRIKKGLEDEVKARKDAAERIRQNRIDTHKKMVSDLLPAWKALYDKLDDLEQLKLLKQYRATTKNWKDLEKDLRIHLEAEGKTEEEIAKEAMRKKRAFYAADLDSFKESILKQRELIRALPAEWKKVYDGLDSLQQARMLKAFNAFENGWKKEAKTLRELFKAQGVPFEGIEKKISEIRRKRIKEELAEFYKKEDAKAYKAEEILQQINEKSARYAGDKYETEAAKAETFYKKIEQRIDQLVASEREKDALRLRNKEVYYERLERMARIHGFGSPEERAGFEVTTGIETDETYGVTSVEKLAEMWRKSGGSLADYIAQLNVLKAEGKLSVDEHRTALERTFAAPGEAFSNGWKRAMDRVRSGSEFLYDLGEQLPDKLADGFTDVWETWLDGTKSAGEAFADFARGALKWIGQIIMKQLILNALQGITGGGGGGAAGPVHVGAGGTTAFKMHTGGIVGSGGLKQRVSSALFNFAPRLHDGINNKLRSDEYPAILQKNEAVFTQDQMKVLAGAGGTSISVPVNIGDSGSGDILKRHLPAAIEEAVLKTMRKYMR